MKYVVLVVYIIVLLLLAYYLFKVKKESFTYSNTYLYPSGLGAADIPLPPLPYPPELLNQIKKAIAVALQGPNLNTQDCPLEPTCKLIVNNISFPGPASKTYSEHAALFFADMITRFVLTEPAHGSHPLVLPKGWDVLKSINYDANPQCYLVWNQHLRSLIVLFKGVTEPKRWNNVLSQVAYTNEGLDLIFHGQQSPDIKIDSEILAEYLTFQGDIWTGVPTDMKHLYVCGHSLGGPFCTLFTIDAGTHPELQKHKIYPIGYGLGSARVGTPQLNIWLNTKTDQMILHHTINLSDMLSYWPFPIIPNVVDPMMPYMYVHGGDVHCFETNLGSIYANHLLPVYLEYLYSKVRL